MISANTNQAEGYATYRKHTLFLSLVAVDMFERREMVNILSSFKIFASLQQRSLSEPDLHAIFCISEEIALIAIDKNVDPLLEQRG